MYQYIRGIYDGEHTLCFSPFSVIDLCMFPIRTGKTLVHRYSFLRNLPKSNVANKIHADIGPQTIYEW